MRGGHKPAMSLCMVHGSQSMTAPELCMVHGSQSMTAPELHPYALTRGALPIYDARDS